MRAWLRHSTRLRHTIRRDVDGGHGFHLLLHALQLHFLYLLTPFLRACIAEMAKWTVDTVAAALFM
jgi:hypothetical protein